jgi:Tfp pilus assembly protein PilE
MKTSRRFSRGFTLVEMMVIAPVVILAVGSFIAVIVSMTGDVLSSRGSNVLAYDIQDALNRIETDVKLSSGFLARNSISFDANNNPQGYGAPGSTTDFTSVGGTSGTSLILSSVATDGNPLATTSRMIYMANQPNACDTYAEYSKNRPMLINIIYFVDSSGTLWRRTVMPADYANTSGQCGGKAPWQQPSCQTNYVNSFCKTNDVKLVSGLGTTGLAISYYPSANSNVASGTATDPVEATRKAALKSMQTVSVTLSSTDSIAGRDISRSGTLRVTRLDTNATAIADTVVTTAPAAPVISSTVSDGSNVNFSWPRVPTATSYQLEYNVNGGAWATPVILDSNTRTYSIPANHEDTVAVRVKSINSAGQSAAYGTASLQIPFWAPLVLNGNWTQYGGTYASAEFSRSSSGLVVLKGLIKKSTATSSGEIIATLPPGYHPTGKLMFGIATNANVTGRIDIDTSGNVILTTGDQGWVSLDSIRFMADGTGMSNIPSYTRNALTLSNGWTNYNNGWATASYVVDNEGRVAVQGLLSPGTITSGTVITSVPAAQRPAKSQILSSHSAVYNEFSSNTTGLIASGYGSGAYSLNAFWFPASPSPALTWTNMTLQNSWVSYDSGVTYELPQYSKTGGENMVSLKGLVKSGSNTYDTPIATLPAGYRPEGRLIFASDNANTFARLDVLPNGEIHFMGSTNQWQSLDGITFHADQ